MLRGCLGAILLRLAPKHFGGGQLCGDKECPFSGVTSSGKGGFSGGMCRKAMFGVWNHASVTTKNWPVGLPRKPVTEPMAHIGLGRRPSIPHRSAAPFRTTEASRRKLSAQHLTVVVPPPLPLPRFLLMWQYNRNISHFFVFSLAAHDAANTEKSFQNRLRRHLFFFFSFLSLSLSVSLVFSSFVSLFTDYFYFYFLFILFLFFVLLLWPGHCTELVAAVLTSATCMNNWVTCRVWVRQVWSIRQQNEFSKFILTTLYGDLIKWCSANYYFIF